MFVFADITCPRTYTIAIPVSALRICCAFECFQCVPFCLLALRARAVFAQYHRFVFFALRGTCRHRGASLAAASPSSAALRCANNFKPHLGAGRQLLSTAASASIASGSGAVLRQARNPNLSLNDVLSKTRTEVTTRHQQKTLSLSIFFFFFFFFCLFASFAS